MNRQDKTTVRNSLIKLARDGVRLREGNGIAELCELVQMSPNEYRGLVDERDAATKALTSGGLFPN
jgi:hypothetical protein